MYCRQPVWNVGACSSGKEYRVSSDLITTSSLVSDKTVKSYKNCYEEIVNATNGNFPFPVHHSHSHSDSHEFSLCFPFPWDRWEFPYHAHLYFLFVFSKSLFVCAIEETDSDLRMKGLRNFIVHRDRTRSWIYRAFGWLVRTSCFEQSAAPPFTLCLLVAVGGIRCWRHPWELITAGFRRCCACNDLKLWPGSLPSSCLLPASGRCWLQLSDRCAVKFISVPIAPSYQIFASSPLLSLLF